MNDLIDLQIKITHLERTVDVLSDIIARQDQSIRDLQDQLRLMYKHLEQKQDGIAAFDLLADRPPHY